MRSVRMLACGVCLLGMLAAVARAEEKKDSDQPQKSPAAKTAKAPRSSQTVALLDVNALFKGDDDFKRQTAMMKIDADAAAAKLKQEAESIKAAAEELNKLTVGSPEHTKLRDELFKRQATLQARVQTQKQDFVQREAKIFNSVYHRISAAVVKYAKEKKLNLVLKFNGEPVNESKPEDILRNINNPVVWHSDNLDITPAIAAQLQTAGEKAKEVGRSNAAVPQGVPAKVTAVRLVSATIESPQKAKKVKLKKAAADKPKPEAKKSAAADEEAVEEEEPADDEPAEQKPAEKKIADKKATEKKTAEKKSSEKKTAQKKATEKKATLVVFTLKGEYPEGPTQPGLFSDLQPSLATLLQRMDQAAEDKSVAAVLLRIESLDVGGGKVNELRAGVARLRKAGKPVYAELVGGDTGQYLLAASCDEIYMPSSGMLIIPGVRAEVTFYKGLLDKLGLKFDALKMGKYKGAVEPFTRSSMSGPLRESLEAIVDDGYNAQVNIIAADRHLKDYQVKTLVDQGLFSATAAAKAGLIDRVCYADEFQEQLRKKLKVDQLDVVTNYKKKKVDTDFSGMGGLMKLMEIFTGGKPAEKPTAAKRIAIVYAVGEIVEGKSTSDMFGTTALGSTTVIEALRKASDDAKVAAVVLRIDSPGGSAMASDLIWRETVRCKKPLIASMGDVAASGGYYIAMSARKIIAEPGTISGSIGVFGGKLVTGGLYEKLGMTTEIISRGANSGALSSTQPFTPAERKAWTALLMETYRQFVTKAAHGRKMDVKKLEELAQGRVYTGRMAKKNGLVDELGTLQDAIAMAKKAAGLKADEEVDLLILPQPKSVFEQLFGGDAAATSDMESLAPELFHFLRQAKVWRRLLSEGTLLWMPYAVRVR